MVDHPAPKGADCASFLKLRASAALGGSIHGGLQTGDLTGRCHLCKPDLERHEIATALSVCFVWPDSSRASLCPVTELVAASPEHNTFSLEPVKCAVPREKAVLAFYPFPSPSRCLFTTWKKPTKVPLNGIFRIEFLGQSCWRRWFQSPTPFNRQVCPFPQFHALAWGRPF